MRQCEFSLVAQTISVVHLWRAVFVCSVVQRRVASCCVVLLLLAGAERSVCLGGQGRASNDGTPAIKTMSLCPQMRYRGHINRSHLSLMANGGAEGCPDGDVARRPGRRGGRGGGVWGWRQRRGGVQKVLKFYPGR